MSGSESFRGDVERRRARRGDGCGCVESTVAGLLYLAAAAPLGRNGVVDATSLTGWIALGGGLLASLAAGKTFGLLLARRRSSVAARRDSS